MESVVFRIYASHRQMLLAVGYIWKYADGPNAAAQFWTRQAFDDRVAVADGMLGIITRCILRLLPKPEARRTALAIFESAQDACNCVADFTSSGILPVALELLVSL